MAAEALDRTDRLMAVLSWAGIAGLGPILPIAIFIAYWSRAGSLAKRHARVAAALWILLFVVWIPLLVVDLLVLRSDAGPVLSIIVYVLLIVAMIVASIIGGLRAWRATVPPSAQAPPRVPPAPPPAH